MASRFQAGFLFGMVTTAVASFLLLQHFSLPLLHRHDDIIVSVEKDNHLPAGSQPGGGDGVQSLHGPHGFVRFSSYQVSATRIAVIGLSWTAHSPLRNLSHCRWHPSTHLPIRRQAADVADADMAGHQGVIDGVLSMPSLNESHGCMYEAAVIFCDLERATEGSGGQLVVGMDSEESIMFHLEASPSSTSSYSSSSSTSSYSSSSSPPPRPSSVAFCGPPMHGKLIPRAIIEWLAYNKFYVGIRRFYFYDAGGINLLIRSAMKDHLENGVVQIVDLKPMLQFPGWYFHQQMAMHDCLYRNRHAARWLLFADPDEYFFVIPPGSPKTIFAEHKRAAFISFARVAFSNNLCAKHLDEGPDPGSKGAFIQNISDEGISSSEPFRSLWADETFAVEHMLWAEKRPICILWGKNVDPNMCVANWGRRKFFINPQKVDLVKIHEPLVANERGVNLDAQLAFHGHFRGIHAVEDGRNLCSGFDAYRTIRVKNTKIAEIAFKTRRKLSTK